MKRARAEIALWSISLICSAGAIARWHHIGSSPPVGVTSTAALQAVREVRPIHLETLVVRAALIRDRNLFRFDRRPATVAFVPAVERMALPPPAVVAQPVRPALAVSGIIGGPPWQALIDGIPGREGHVLAYDGAVFGEIRIRKITRDSVVITGSDTTWRLALKRAWQ
ncbi:MAG: hypothetical protein ABR543_10720 [Gemmatimonadaceae bacterium]